MWKDENGFNHLTPKTKTLKRLFENDHDEKKVVFRHGHIAITNYRMGDNKEFEKSLSTFDEIRWKYNPVGFYYVKPMRELRINRGYDIHMLKKFFPNHKFVVDNDAYEYKKADIKLKTGPRDDFQKVALTFMAGEGRYKANKNYTQILIDLQTGAGKAQPNDTKIPTPDGWRKLKDIEVGDFVFNKHGEPVEVLGVFPQKGLQRTYEVTFSDGRSTRCNGEHLWEVYRNHNKYPTVCTLAEIMKDYHNVQYDKGGKPHNHHIYQVKINDAVEYPEQPVPVDPYVLGVFIGNGYFGSDSLLLSSGNMDVPREVSKVLGCPTQLRSKWNYNYKFIREKRTSKEGKKYNRYVQTDDFLEKIPELINAKSGHKFIPDVYKYNSIEVRKQLIQGLFDTDGHISGDKYQISYTTISKRLMKDIVEVLRSLGYSVKVTKDNRTAKYTSGECFEIYVRCPDENKHEFFRANKKSLKRAYAAKEYHTKKNQCMISIVDIKEVEPTKQRCILIDDPDHVYLTEDYIPTHNTYCGTAMSCYNNARVSIFVPFTKLLEQWKESFLNFTDVDPDDIMIVQGSDACMKILKGKKKHIKVFLFMIDTISSFEAQYGPIKTMEMLEATQSYMKIIDEVHLDIKAIAMIEALSNFRMNFYLSASPGRTASKENWIFKTLFYNVPKFGSKDMMQSEKYLNIIIKQYKFMPDPIQMKSIINPRKKWLNTKAYETALFNASDQQRASFEQALLQMLNWIKKQIKPEFKVILFCNTIEGTEYLKNVAERVFPGECSRYYGTMGSKKEKEDALKQRVICATSSSLGTGADIKGLQFCINTCTYSSKIEAIQVSGRLRKLPNDPVAYIELVNVGWYKTMKQFEKRKPTLISRSRTNKLLIIE